MRRPAWTEWRGGTLLKIDFQPTRVRTGHADTEGRLTIVNGEIVAVLVRVDDPVHETQRGHWFLEVGFGPCESREFPSFRDFEEVTRWIAERLS